MIYEYPEEFVVPIVYAEDLKEKFMNRDWELKYFQVDKLITPDEKSQEDEILQKDKYEDQNISNKGMGFLDLDADLLKKPYYEKDMSDDNEVENIIKDDNSKSIFSEIDNEYADSETLRM